MEMGRSKTNNKNAMLFVLITVMINSIGFGIMIPVLPDLLKELTDLPNNEAALYGMWLTFVFALFQFICMPIVGGLSDRFGRRPIMLLSLLGLGFDYFIMGFAPTIAFLFIGRIIAGAFGATFSTANAYIADISPPETRAQNFSLINVVYGFIFLPETLTEDKRRPFEWKRSNPFGSIKSLGRIKGVKSLIFIMFLLAMAHTVYPSTYAFSTLFWAAFIGIVSTIIAYTMMGSADKGWIIYAAGPFAALSGLYGPALNNMMSSRISASEQGELQGALGAAQGLALMIGPFLMAGMFWYFGDTKLKDPAGLHSFPENIILIGKHIFSNDVIPYLPGAPFLMATESLEEI